MTITSRKRTLEICNFHVPRITVKVLLIPVFIAMKQYLASDSLSSNTRTTLFLVSLKTKSFLPYLIIQKYSSE